MRKLATILLIAGITIVTACAIWENVLLRQTTRGDLNLDGKVNILDLSLFATHYNK